MPSDQLAHGARHQGGQECAQVDAHVKNRIPTGAPRVVRSVIQITHQGRGIGFEKTVANNQQTQCNKEQGLKCHGKVPQHHEHATDQQRSPFAQVAIGQCPTQHGGQIDQPCVGAVQGQGIGALVMQGIHHIEDEQGAHPVVAEPFPHFSEKDNPQALGLRNRWRFNGIHGVQAFYLLVCGF